MAECGDCAGCECCRASDVTNCISCGVGACSYAVYIFTCTLISQNACSSICGFSAPSADAKMETNQQKAAMLGEKVGKVGDVEIRMAVKPLNIGR